MMTRIFRILAVSGIFFGLVLLAGCATLPKQENTEESLRNTASFYWELRMDDKYRNTFGMEYPETLKKDAGGSKPDYEAYLDRAKALKNTAITSYSLKDVAVQDDKGRVSVEFVFTLPDIPKPVRQTIADEWIFHNGKWLHVLPR